MFRILAELKDHDGAVRAIASDSNNIYTGAMDSLVHWWSCNSYTMLPTVATDANGWVTSLLVLPAPLNILLVGGMDKCIRSYSTVDGTLLKTFIGHNHGVISLAVHPTHPTTHFISGSWDETGRVWNLDTGECLTVLSGHENGVCVLGLVGDSNATTRIVTGSTGRQVQNKVVDFCLRIWSISDNHHPTILHTVKDHAGPIRQLINLPNIGFISCSNDGSVNVRNFNGESLRSIGTTSTPSFALSVSRVPSTGEILSAHEDGVLRIWSPDTGDLIQQIEHPAGLWCVHVLENEDVVTGSDDKVARVFSKNGFNEKLEIELQRAVTNGKKGPSKVEVEKLVDFDNRESVRGKSTGDVRMFNKNGKAWACQWSDDTTSWVEIGEVTGSNNTDDTMTIASGSIDGVSFDIVIPVEIENPRTMAVQNFQIGFNAGDNPYVVAQSFIDKHMLDQNYLSQIADYIVQRTAGSLEPNPSTTPSTTPTFKYFPQRGYVSFDSLKISKLMETLKKINAESIPESKKLRDADLSQVESIVALLQQTAYYHSTEFTTLQCKVVSSVILNWPTEHLFPMLDLVRLMMMHPHGVTLFNVNTNTTLLHRIIEIATSDEVIPRMLALRILTNMATTSAECRALLINNTSRIITSLQKLLNANILEHKPTRLSVSALVLNIIAASVKNLDDSLVFEFVLCLLKKVQELSDTVSCLRCLISIGTLLLNNPSLKTPAVIERIKITTSNNISSDNDDTRECLKELSILLN